MVHDIVTDFREDINTIIIRMPEKISLALLQQWKNELLDLLENEKRQGLSLLMDTNTHNFESIDCLKFFRDLLLNNSVVKKYIIRAAFVTPKKFRQPEIVSIPEIWHNRPEFSGIDILKSETPRRQPTKITRTKNECTGECDSSANIE